MATISNSTAQRTCGYIDCTHPQIPLGKARLCGRCKEVAYCDRECQKAAWLTHKIGCRTFVDQKKPEHKEKVSMLRQGNTVSFQSMEDVVSFSSCFSAETIEELKKKNYSGFANLKPEFFQQCDYVEVLKCLWTEENLDRKISWLRKCVEKGHPILMLELSRALMQKSEKNAEECVKWFILGLYCTRLDISCNSDASTGAAIGVLKMNYGPAVQKAFDMLKDEIETIQKNALESFDPSQLQSSPKWVTLHGMNKYLGKDSMNKKETWAETRLNKHKELLQQVK